METGPLHRRVLAASAAVLVGALALSGCGSSSGSKSSSSGSSGSSSGALAKIKKSGTINIATDASYAPNEFMQGGKIVGFDVDLANAIAKNLGVKANVTNVSFDNILPALASGKYDTSLSSFTDTKKREQAFTFVTYYSAGTGLMVKVGNPENLQPSDTSLCGKKIAVEKGTTQESELMPASSTNVGGGTRLDACKKANKPAPKRLSFDDENGANLALSTGRADAVLADSPVAAYAAKQSGGKFVISGAPYGTAPYGIPVPKKETDLSNAILGAVKALIADGTYKQITDKWGISAGDITTPQLNGATS